MAKVCVVKYDYKADIKVFVVNNPDDADLLYFEVEREYQARGDEMWLMTDDDYNADVRIMYVNQEFLADLKVFKVDQQFKAKWMHDHTWRGRLSSR